MGYKRSWSNSRTTNEVTNYGGNEKYYVIDNFILITAIVFQITVPSPKARIYVV